MSTMSIYNGKTSQTFVIINLLASLLAACTSQPAPVTESASPTQAPPSPTVTMEPPMSATETPMPVTEYEQLIGKWRTRCGGGPCTLEFKPDGTYRNAYIHKTETGITFIDGGKVTFTDGILHFVATNGYCEVENRPNGYYTAALFRGDNNLYLVLTPAPKDECADRQSAYTREMKFLGE